MCINIKIVMSTKTISLSEDAYDRLKALKKDKESFSDLVKRLCSGVKLRDFYGVLSEKSAEEIEKTIQEKREEHRKVHEERINQLKEA